MTCATCSCMFPPVLAMSNPCTPLLHMFPPVVTASNLCTPLGVSGGRSRTLCIGIAGISEQRVLGPGASRLGGEVPHGRKHLGTLPPPPLRSMPSTPCVVSRPHGLRGPHSVCDGSGRDRRGWRGGALSRVEWFRQGCRPRVARTAKSYPVIGSSPPSDRASVADYGGERVLVDCAVPDKKEETMPFVWRLPRPPLGCGSRHVVSTRPASIGAVHRAVIGPS